MRKKNANKNCHSARSAITEWILIQLKCSFIEFSGKWLPRANRKLFFASRREASGVNRLFFVDERIREIPPQRRGSFLDYITPERTFACCDGESRSFNSAAICKHSLGIKSELTLMMTSIKLGVTFTFSVISASLCSFMLLGSELKWRQQGEGDDKLQHIVKQCTARKTFNCFARKECFYPPLLVAQR